jgi:Ca-activated chloride channel family protein
MSFESPHLLAALIVVPAIVAAYVSSIRRRARRAATLATQGLVTTASSARLGKRRHVPFVFFTLALAALVVALARPQTDLTTPRREGTVILAFDVSNSMAADDLEPSRIEAAKTAARAFVERQPSTIKIGIVAFGDSAVLVQQPTDTPEDVIAAIDRLSVEGGTSLGQGLFASLTAIAGKPIVIDEAALANDLGQVDIGYFGSSTIVLLSDGENNSEPDPLAVAQIASVAGVHIHAIGVGTPEGTVVDIGGFNVATALDRELLTQVAGVSDGTYFEATDAASLTDIYKNIDLDFKSVTEHTEVTALFTAGAALLLLIGALLSVFWFGRVV